MSKEISPNEAHELLENKKETTLLLDVRSPAEFASTHAAGAVNIPLERVTDPDSLRLLKDKTVLCICQKGGRGRKAVVALLGQGMTNVVNVEGGTSEWTQAKLPTVNGKPGISIERQVRICAGGLVLVGSLLGVSVSLAFLAIPIFIGAGLLFSGITDTCGMAHVLARCPWNK